MWSRTSALTLLATTFGAVTPTFAQGEGAVHGAVTAQADGSALTDAVVEFEGATLPAPLRATTSADGRFAFRALVSGEHVLTLAHPTFQERRYRLGLKPREVRNVDVALDLRPLQASLIAHLAETLCFRMTL